MIKFAEAEKKLYISQSCTTKRPEIFFCLQIHKNVSVWSRARTTASLLHLLKLKLTLRFRGQDWIAFLTFMIVLRFFQCCCCCCLSSLTFTRCDRELELHYIFFGSIDVFSLLIALINCAPNFFLCDSSCELDREMRTNKFFFPKIKTALKIVIRTMITAYDGRSAPYHS